MRRKTFLSRGGASGGLDSLNGLTGSVQTFATGTSGTNFAISSSGTTHTFNIPSSSAANRGLLLAADWSTFNSKVGGSGTSGTIPKFTASGTIGNSIITETAGAISVAGTLGIPSLTPAGIVYNVPTTGILTTDANLQWQAASGLAIQGGKGIYRVGSVSGTITHAIPTTITDYTVTEPAVQGAANSIYVNNGSGVLSWSTAPTFTNITDSGLTANAFLYSGTAGLLTTTSAPTNGQILIGSTGAAPVLASLTAGSNITITPGAGSISIASTASGGGTAPIIRASSAVPVTSGLVFPNVHVSAGSGFKYFDGYGVADATTLTGDAIWALMFPMPPVLPAGTAKLRVRAIANATSGAMKFNPKWASNAIEEDGSSLTLQAEGTQTITWGASDNDQWKELDVTLDADTVTADEMILLHLTFEDSGYTLAVTATVQAYIVFIV